MSAMTIAVGIFISIRNGLAPRSTTFELDVIDVGASVDNVDIYTLAAITIVEVLVESAEAKAVAMRDTGKTPWSADLGRAIIGLQGMDLRVFLNIGNL